MHAFYGNIYNNYIFNLHTLNEFLFFKIISSKCFCLRYEKLYIDIKASDALICEDYW